MQTQITRSSKERTLEQLRTWMVSMKSGHMPNRTQDNKAVAGFGAHTVETTSASDYYYVVFHQAMMYYQPFIIAIAQDLGLKVGELMGDIAIQIPKPIAPTTKQIIDARQSLGF